MTKGMQNALWRQYRWHLVSFIAGVVVGVMFAGLLRGIVTVLVLVGLVIAAYFIWSFFENQKRS